MNNSTVRKGCQDIWNAFMVEGASFSQHDIPFCPSTATHIPEHVISFVEAKTIYNKAMLHDDCEFHNNSFIHFYIDDQKFDSGKSGIWVAPYKAYDIIKHFSGIFTPDFSTYADFPDPLKRWNTYRMRAFGFWLSKLNIPVINNVRWGGPETWEYCFDGLPTNGILSIGTVASGLRVSDNRTLFDAGIKELVRRATPRALVIYGSSRYPIFTAIKEHGIEVISFQSATSIAFERRSSK